MIDYFQSGIMLILMGCWQLKYLLFYLCPRRKTFKRVPKQRWQFNSSFSMTINTYQAVFSFVFSHAALISSHDHIQRLLTHGVKHESNFNIRIFLKMRPQVSHFLQLLVARGMTVFILLYLISFSVFAGLP